MTLSTGTRLGPYEIVAPLGSGGMGEVYRARDTRLGREVAIKVLPADFSHDSARLQRFEQEARATGLLNHPNILAIFDIGTQGGSPYVVSELLEGQTLRERLADGAFPLRKAVDCAAQVARGLAAAHAKGIVHRDLKPENLFVTHDGRVKILDFGLAKLTQDNLSGSGFTNLPTTPAAPTAPGTVLGTVGYMSPEQVRGLPTDHRSDIFALGAILHETLSGRRAFHGDSAVETLNAILKEDPPSLAATNRTIPAALERIVLHCLEKQPEERFQSARDVAFDLESIAGSSTPSAGVQAQVGARRGAGWWSRLAISAGVAAIAIAGFAIGKLAAPAPAAAPPVYQKLTFQRGWISAARFAPDGQTIIYSAAWNGRPLEIFQVRPGSPESLPLGLQNCEIQSVSRTGELAILRNPRVANNWYFRSGTLAVASLGGGAPRDLLENVAYADWAPDGKNIAVVRRIGGQHVLEFPAGRRIYETAEVIANPRVSPDGEHVAFFEGRGFGLGSSVVVVDRAGKKRFEGRQFRDWWFLAWSPDGREIWLEASESSVTSALFAVDLQGSERSLASSPGFNEIHDVAPDGRALMTSVSNRRPAAGLPPEGGEEIDLSWLQSTLPADLSPDGKSLLFRDLEDRSLVFLRRMDGSPAVRLGEGVPATLSPDGQWTLAMHPSGLMVIPTGAGKPATLAGGKFATLGWAEWFPGGDRVLLSAAEPGKGFRLYILEAEGGEPAPLSPEGFTLTEQSKSISPNGSAVVAIDPEGRLVLLPLAGGEPRPIPGIEPGDRIVRWTADGRALFVLRPGQIPTPVFRLDVLSGQRTLWKELAPHDRAGVGTLGSLVMTPDGRTYAYSFQQTLSELYLVTGLK